jgi:hypothetical protein
MNENSFYARIDPAYYSLLARTRNLRHFQEHPWVTKNGRYPLMSTEENCTLVTVTEEEVDNSVTSVPKIETLVSILFTESWSCISRTRLIAPFCQIMELLNWPDYSNKRAFQDSEDSNLPSAYFAIIRIKPIIRYSVVWVRLYQNFMFFSLILPLIDGSSQLNAIYTNRW